MKSYAELGSIAKNELNSLLSNRNDIVSRFIVSVEQSFDASFELSVRFNTSTLERFFYQVASLQNWFNFCEDLRDQVMPRWPFEPIVFGKFRDPADSALHAAILFSAHMNFIVQQARIDSVSDLDDEEILDRQFQLWESQIHKKLRAMPIHTGEWTPEEMYRDRGFLMRRILKERILFAEKNKPDVSQESNFPLSSVNGVLVLNGNTIPSPPSHQAKGLIEFLLQQRNRAALATYIQSNCQAIRNSSADRALDNTINIAKKWLKSHGMTLRSDRKLESRTLTLEVLKEVESP